MAPVKNMVQNEVGEEEGHGEGFWEVPDVSGYDDDESQIGDEDSSSSSTEKNGLYYLEIPEGLFFYNTSCSFDADRSVNIPDCRFWSTN